MRLHKNLVYAVVDTAHRIFNEGVYADKAVERTLKSNKRWGSRDRGFIAETVYEIVRWKRLYSEVAEVKEPFERKDLFKMVGVWAVLRGVDIPPWDEFKYLPKRKIKGRYDAAIKSRAVRESIPDWLDETAVKELGEKLWTAELKALNKQAPVVLRTNTLKTNRQGLKKTLQKDGIGTKELKSYPEALELEERANVFSTEAFKKGLFEVQDASSQKVAHFVNPEPGMRVVDACAGAGGKSLHLASLMENKGQIIALDIYENKLKELKRRARRNGAHNIETRTITNNKVIKKLEGKADRVLIDAPCTGLGVLRRNPDAKWKLSPEFLESVTRKQQEILRRYSKIVRPGGLVVYATCSILPRENDDQIREFLGTEIGKSFTLEAEDKVWASESGYDGFYMAALRRSN